MPVNATGPYVPGHGILPSDIMIVGDSPDPGDIDAGEPFRDRGGREQDRFLMLSGIHRSRCYVTYLIKRQLQEGTDAGPDDIQLFAPDLWREIGQCKPRYLLAVGAIATRYFLGSDADLDTVHGRPYFMRHREGQGIVVIPCHHPNFGLRDGDAKALVFWDYQQAGDIVRGRISGVPVSDEWPDPVYVEGTGDEPLIYPMGVDTEGIPGHEWGFSISSVEGTGFVYRRGTRHFDIMVRRLQEAAHEDPVAEFLMHNGMYDIEMMRLMGVNLSNARILDTMVMAYLLRIEPQGLKALARRHCGMVMNSYEETIGDAALIKWLEFLHNIADGDWPKSEPELIYENDGTCRLYKPQPVATRARKILDDWAKKPEDTDLEARYKKIGKAQRKVVESVLGPFPVATLDDIPLSDAVYYSGRDPDATLRVFNRLAPRVKAAKLWDLLELKCYLLPVFEEMQSTGMPAQRSHFESLVERMTEQMQEIQQRISFRYCGGKPFNPNSAQQIEAKMRELGIVGAKKNKKTGRMKTDKKSIEHLRHQEDFIGQTIDWKERAKVRDSFALPILDKIPEDADIHPVRANIKITRVSSGRLAATDPPLLAMPITELGIQIRKGFKAGPGRMFATADLSQIEMRVMADEAMDPLLCQLFRENRDIHAETAARLFHVPLAQVDKKKQRNPTKRAGFGVITGIQGPGLLDQLRMMGCEGWEVTKDGTDVVSEWCPEGIINGWFSVFPTVKGYLKRCGDECETNGGYVKDRGGMIRYLPGVFSRDEYMRAEARRQSHSHKIQGTAQWMIQMAMAWLRPRLDEFRNLTGGFLRWSLQIHDELIFWFDEDLHDSLKDLVLEALRDHTPRLRVPVDANWASAADWGSLEK